MEGAGKLVTLGTLLDQIRSLKRFPDQQILISAITGPTDPYTVYWVSNPQVDPDPRPHVGASCTSPDGSTATPAVRINQMAAAFGPNGLILPVCGTDWAPSFQRLGDLLNR